MKQNATPVLDSRWPFPVVLIFLFTSILIPSIAILAIYAPILAEAVSYHPQIYALEYSSVVPSPVKNVADCNLINLLAVGPLFWLWSLFSSSYFPSLR